MTKRRTKTAYVIALTLTILCVVSASFATPVHADTLKPTIYIDYLGTGTSPATSAKKITQVPAQGQPFWIGVRLANIGGTYLGDPEDEENRYANFLKETGLRDLDIAFEYDSNLIRPAYTMAAAETPASYTASAYESAAGYTTSALRNTAWRSLVTNGNLSTDTTAVFYAYQSFSYEVSGGSSMDYTLSKETAEDGREVPSYQAKTNWKMAYVGIEKKETDSETPSRFAGGTVSALSYDSASAYIVRLPFVFVADPKAMKEARDGEDDAKRTGNLSDIQSLGFLHISLSPSTFAMDTGLLEDTDPSYAWEKETRKNEDSHNLKKLFTYDEKTNFVDLLTGTPLGAVSLSNISIIPIHTEVDPEDENKTIEKEEAELALYEKYTADESEKTGGKYGTQATDVTAYADKTLYAANILPERKLKITIEGTGLDETLSILRHKINDEGTAVEEAEYSITDDANQPVYYVHDSEKNTYTIYVSEDFLYPVDGTGYSKAKPSDPANKTKLDYGFKSALKIGVGEDTYIFNLRKLIKPEIKLNYGNSVVGMIMTDDVNYPTQADKEQAIEDFRDYSNVENRIFNGRVFYPNAWYSYEITDENDEPITAPYIGDGPFSNIKMKNGDEDIIVGTVYDGDIDPYAIFVYLGRLFKDPGIAQVLDEFCISTPGANISVSLIGAKAYSDFAGVPRYTSTEDESLSVLGGGDGLVVKPHNSNTQIYDVLTKYIIRPDVYSLCYQFIDSSNTAYTIERKMIVITKVGDILIEDNTATNDNDSAMIVANKLIFDDSNSYNSLFKYRVADVLEDAVVNDNDAAYVTANKLLYDSLSEGYYFYKPLPTS